MAATAVTIRGVRTVVHRSRSRWRMAHWGARRMRVLYRAPMFPINMGTRRMVMHLLRPTVLRRSVPRRRSMLDLAHMFDMAHAPVLGTMRPIAMPIGWTVVPMTDMAWMPMDGSIAVPARALTIERTLPIMVVPVGADYEADDRNADLRTVLWQQHAPVAILVAHVIASDPTALATGDHVAPLPTRGAPLHDDPASRGNDVDQWIADIRSGAQAEIGGDVGVLGQGRQWRQHQQGSQRGQEQSLYALYGLAVHGVFLIMEGRIRLRVRRALGGQDDIHTGTRGTICASKWTLAHSARSCGSEVGFLWIRHRAP